MQNKIKKGISFPQEEKSQLGTKAEKRRKGQRSVSSLFFFFLVCCGGDVAVTREMLTCLYFGITMPCAGRQIAGDKASPDWGTQRRDTKWAGACPPGVTQPRLALCANTCTRAGKQITRIAACPDDFSQTNAQSMNTYVPIKSLYLPTCASCFCRLWSDAGRTLWQD